MNLTEYIRSKNRPVYMPYLTVGDPDFDATVDFALAMCDAGADLLELGIPFSDPTADGPVIQAAMVRALARPEFSLDGVFDVAARIHRARPGVPLVFLSYLNPVLRGLAGGTAAGPGSAPGDGDPVALRAFLARCQSSGVRGLVIPDLPFDQPEAHLLREEAEGHQVAQILMIAPNTGRRRFQAICRAARGFIYYVTSYGVTGERQTLPEDLGRNIARVRETAGLPVLAGFGISRPEQVVPLRSILDGVIVGSLHHRIIEAEGRGAALRLGETTRAFVAALESAPVA